MEMILEVLIQYTIELVGMIIITLLGIFGTWVLNKINKNKELKNIALATEQVIGAAQGTVKELQQTLVDSWKANQDGKLKEEQVNELKQKTIDITIAKLSKPTINLLTAAMVDIKTLITSTAEGYISERKKSGE